MISSLLEKRNRTGTTYYENNEGEIVFKICRKCREKKSMNDYSKQKEGLGGRTSICRKCDSIRGKKYEEDNQEKRNEYKRKYREENKEKIRIYYQKYYIENKEKELARTRKWYKDNKTWARERNKRYRMKNKAREIERQRKWYLENKGRILKRARIWARKNPIKITLKNQRRRTLERRLPNTLTEEQYKETLRFFGGRCALSGENEKIEIDHAIPLSTGYGGTTKKNCYPLSKSLNSSKQNKNLFEWFEENKERFALNEDKFTRLVGFLASENEMTVDEYKRFYYECFKESEEIG